MPRQLLTEYEVTLIITKMRSRFEVTQACTTSDKRAKTYLAELAQCTNEELWSRMEEKRW